MAKKLLSILMGTFLAFSLVACGGGDQGGNEEPDQEEQAPDEAQEPADEGENKAAGYDAEAAQALYNTKCSSCHGDNLQGNIGPKLSAIGSKYSKDEIVSIIQNGKGQMPAGLVEGDEADNLAAWLADKKE
ncbi:cytochrome c551 [Pseudalkalibacillus caeni]|uniref:Cytochrome c n=1 Tax=Exobacillus caeni TaxID=2574798 RepID=A0A5R9FG35_9BACL|nr:cytochrome c [Pseudalkalibacillus caeni]TLS38515.1 cytochrome c [Pseudalkalibacillus caeni]